jgi:membrane protein
MTTYRQIGIEASRPPVPPPRARGSAGSCLALRGFVFAYFRATLPWTVLLRRTVADSIADGLPGLAAQLAFYFFLALFPALLFVVSLLAYLPVEPAVAELLMRLEGLLPPEAIALVRAEIDKLLKGDREGLITFGVAGALWSSSSAMMAVISTLNHAYDIDEWRPWWETRSIAIVLTFALALFVLVAFALVVAGGHLAAAVAAWGGFGAAFEPIWRTLQWPIALFLVIVAIDLVYYFAPNADTKWVWITPGSLLATALWLAASLGFRLYLRHVSDLAVVYGAIGSVIVMLLWLYLSAFAILAGAELNAEIDRALPERERSPQPSGGRRKIGPAIEES